MTRGRLGTVLLATSLTLMGCDPSQLFDPTLPQGIDGVALLGPQCPVQTVANPCPDLPHQASIDVLDGDLEFVVRIQSDENGEFRVGLVPGHYVLSPEQGNPFPTAGPQDVVVREGEYTDVVVNFDTGIR